MALLERSILFIACILKLIHLEAEACDVYTSHHTFGRSGMRPCLKVNSVTLAVVWGFCFVLFLRLSLSM